MCPLQGQGGATLPHETLCSGPVPGGLAGGEALARAAVLRQGRCSAHAAPAAMWQACAPSGGRWALWLLRESADPSVLEGRQESHPFPGCHHFCLLRGCRSCVCEMTSQETGPQPPRRFEKGTGPGSGAPGREGRTPPAIPTSRRPASPWCLGSGLTMTGPSSEWEP